MASIKQNGDLGIHTYSKEMCDVFDGYHSYVTDTLDGKHGKTAQFWISYVQMIHIYHEFSRSIRSGDLDMYIACLQKISNYFFVMNHPNNACWTVKYHDSLLKILETHPGVYKEFKKGWFTIK